MRNRSLTKSWDFLAHGILALALLTGACGGAGQSAVKACKHSPCHTGSALTGACDIDCVDIICQAHKGCCGADGGTWTPACVGFVTQECHQQCNCAATTVEGDPFNRYACDCTNDYVCPQPGNACCKTHWGSSCVDAAVHYSANGCTALP